MGTAINRRDFIRYAGGGVAALVVGSRLKWMFDNPLYVAAAVQNIELEIGDAIKQMVTHLPANPAGDPGFAGNDARCYFWVYKAVNPNLPADCPGPNIFCTQGDTINIAVTNQLDEPHSFFIPGFAPGDPPVVDSGSIAPGARWPATGTFAFTATTPGAYLYFDNLNAPVNRVMGLHGAFVVMPAAAAAGHKFTPYANPTPGVQKLFDDFGSSAHFPGLGWEQGDSVPASFAPAFRTYIWLDHQAAPNLFQEVGSLGPGVEMNAQTFVNSFLRGAFDATNSANFKGAQYFTINGQSGWFSHGNPHMHPILRVGEPCIIHILNAGLWTHSMHLHANHFYLACKNGVVQENPWWLDVFEVAPMDRIDYVIPFMRPPDVPNARGIGFPDTPQTSLANALIPGSAPHPVWPPTEELSFAMPAFSIPAQTPPGVIAPVGVPTSTALAQDGVTPIDLGVRCSPICYPMHDHSEPSQTSQGGNYNLGLIAGMDISGDRNINPAAVTTFPDAPTEFPPNTTGPAAPPFRL